MTKTRTRPIFFKLLIAAAVVYVIGTSVLITDLYCKLGKMQHVLSHKHSEH